MKRLPLIISFLPLIAFSLLARLLPSGDIGFAALAGAVLAAIALATARPVRPPKILNCCSLALFAALAVAGFTAGSGDDRWLAHWAGSGIGIVIGLAILLLIPALPFTEQYARESTPRAYWASPTFKQINRVLSAGWAAAFVAIGVSRCAAVLIEEHSSHHALPELVFGAGIPIVILAYTLKFTQRYPKRVAAGSAGRPA